MAALEIYTNDGTTTATGTSGTTAPASGTQETWTVSSSSSFPAASSNANGTIFHIADPALPTEKIKVINVSGTTWTVIRGDENTTPVAHLTGATYRNVITANNAAKILDWIVATSPLFGADPTGTIDSTAAINNALQAAVPGQCVYLPAGTYAVTSPIILGQAGPPAVKGVMLRGAQPVSPALGFNITDEFGTIIQATAAWTHGSISATNNPGVVYINGNSTTINRPGLKDLWIDISLAPAGTHGFSSWGGAFHGSISGVGVVGPANTAAFTGTGNLMMMAADAGGNRWDGASVDHVMLQNAAGYGLWFHGQDTEFIDVHAQAYQASTGSLAGIYLDNANNCRLVSCRSDQSGDSGFVIDSNPGGSPNSPGSTIALIGCGTESNNNYGLKVINSSTGGNAQPRTPVNVTGCSFDFDGRQGGLSPTSGSGIYVQGVNVVTISDTNVTTSGNQGSTNLHFYPEYALTTATPGVPQKISWRGGVVNCNSGPINDGAACGPHVEFGTVIGSAWINTSTVGQYSANLPATPNGTWLPNTANAFLGWNSDPVTGSGGGLLVAGTLYLTRLNFYQLTTLTNLWYWITALGAGASSTGTFAGVYSSAGSLLTGSADQLAVFNASGAVGASKCILTTPQNFLPGQWAWGALLVNLLTTQPTLLRQQNTTSALNGNLTAANFRWATNGTGLTALPASIVPASNAATAFSLVAAWS